MDPSSYRLTPYFPFTCMRFLSCSSSVVCWKASALANLVVLELQIIARKPPDLGFQAPIGLS